ncbi:hypothetical protein HCG51_04510 [Tolypothrix sp. PCC 7910]|uniref:hypothetical protein n=1 Tax=Tolypothrix sp. PCC 7910 TaxID=2099387 RepID=UPI0014277751|nr:hypothetical protein [Tolypothrix sp. PCC 7910]QIR36097.1 hypothetical protein HCG51_04510 [Tolypothrix sp. PCC 7910]
MHDEFIPQRLNSTQLLSVIWCDRLVETRLIRDTINRVSTTRREDSKFLSLLKFDNFSSEIP